MMNQLVIRALTWDIYRIDQRWGKHEHCDPYWRLYINKRKGAGLQLASGTYEIVPQCIHLIPAWTKMACHGANVVEHFYIHFDLVGISRPVVEELFGSPKFLPERVDFEKILKPLRNSSGNYLRKNAASLCYVKSLLYESFGKLLTLLEKDKLSKIERLASGNPRFADILRYIDSHLSAQLDNERLAELAQMSTSHFIRCFREDVGQPPAQYVLEQRIAAAARQLVHTEQSIEQIARQTGFGNRFYFTRAFSKVMSMPPAAYRKLPMV